MVIVSEGGGQSVSQRLTTGSSSSSPIFSPSGTLLAYAGGATGSNEVYIIDADGRRPRRVTYCGGSSRPVSFSLDEVREIEVVSLPSLLLLALLIATYHLLI